MVQQAPRSSSHPESEPRDTPPTSVGAATHTHTHTHARQPKTNIIPDHGSIDGDLQFQSPASAQVSPRECAAPQCRAAAPATLLPRHHTGPQPPQAPPPLRGWQGPQPSPWQRQQRARPGHSTVVAPHVHSHQQHPEPVPSSPQQPRAAPPRTLPAAPTPPTRPLLLLLLLLLRMLLLLLLRLTLGLHSDAGPPLVPVTLDELAATLGVPVVQHQRECPTTLVLQQPPLHNVRMQSLPTHAPWLPALCALH